MTLETFLKKAVKNTRFQPANNTMPYMVWDRVFRDTCFTRKQATLYWITKGRNGLRL